MATKRKPAEPRRPGAAPLTTGPYFDSNLFFQSDDGEGWSEHYLIQQANADLAQATLAGLVPLRCAILDNHFKIVNGRVSDETIHGDSYPVADIAFPQAGTFTSTGAVALMANAAIKVRLLGDPPLKGLIYMRGLNDIIVVGRHFTGDSTWNIAFGAYAAYLVDPANAFYMSLEDPPGSGVVSKIAVQHAVVDGVTARKPGRPFGLPVGRRKRQLVVSTSAARALTGSGAATQQKRG
jgi:hypothetical protein